jgi:hypothetical protein
MLLREVAQIKECKNENELIKIAEKIGDQIIFKSYEEEQVVILVNVLLELDLLAMKYTTREEILSVLCDAVSNYDVSRKINWDRISSISDKLEDDLKEYIKDFLHN